MTISRHLPDIKPNNGGLARRDRLRPFVFGAGLVAAGALLSRFRPGALDMPNPSPMRDVRSGRFGQAVRMTRDGVEHVAPDNLSAKIGSSLAIAGAAMIAARLLDEVSGHGR
ncbi:hypothetical protein ACRARG_08460 [Pseudooceanicola sp. C21-150M6]|uniref:hypothetical protein n=1 Tax=Pseudooceanicola sp. C21-150M6 TaxID=3434355 RepID=UPI003D7F6D91